MMKTVEMPRPSPELLARIHSMQEQKGMTAAIVPGTEEFFIGKNTLDAFHKAREKYPDGLFHFVRIGYPQGHFLKGERSVY